MRAPHPLTNVPLEELSPAATLALVNVAKILQCAANHTHWNPEKVRSYPCVCPCTHNAQPFASAIDKFIDTELQPLIDSLSQDVLVRS